MTRLFIMDDEVLTRQGIRHSIRWQDYGITVCGEAANGREALRVLPKSTPDIIIADIQMPQMDGFAFLEKAIEILPHLRVIILTGYSNPEYMIRAIRCGAFDYLEKPADSSAILTAVLKAQHSIQQEQEEVCLRERAVQLLNETGSVLRAWLIQSLLTNSIEEGFARQVGALLGIPISEGCLYRILLARPMQAQEWTLLAKLSETFRSDMLYTLGDLGLVGGLVEVSIPADAIQTKLAATDALQGLCSGPVLITDPLDPLESGQLVYAAAKARLAVSYLYDSGSIHLLHLKEPKADAAPLDVDALLNHIEHICLAAERGCLPDILDIGAQTLNLLSSARVHENVFYDIVQHMFLRLLHSTRRTDRIAPVMDFLHAKPSLSAIHSGFCALVQVDSTAFPIMSPIIEKAIAYMEKHFREPLSVAQMAKMFYLSPAYWGRQFKKETKMSFSVYLTGLRIQEAKRLLRNTPMRNYEIATTVGFSSYKLFAITFQRLVGLSASEYRKKYQLARPDAPVP